jgi:uncharacterized membrane protein YdbT with pleckstrin-like domain
MRTKLRENETIVMITKRHPVTIIWLYAATIALLVLRVWPFRASSKPVTHGLLWVCLVLLLISIIKTWSRQRDIWVVTDQRVVDEAGIFTIRSMECPLDKITNVMIAQSVPGRILGYGKIQIQTAGEAGLNEVVKVMRPRAFRNAIFEQQERSRERMMQLRAKMEVEQAMEEGEMKECPFCAERIKAKAIVCRFCNRELPREG